MNILAILETLEETIEKSIGIPFSGMCLVDREELLEFVKEARLKLPDDIKQAKWIKDERQRILLDAQKEADYTMKEIKIKVSDSVNEHEITKKAYEQANEILSGAQKTAKEIRLGTREYADTLLDKIEGSLKEALDVVQSNRTELK